MNDPAILVLRFFQFLFVPIFLCAPLVMVLSLLTWRNETIDRELLKTKIRTLSLATLSCLAVWLIVLIIALVTRSSLLQLLSTMAWLLFFPLWFGIAMPIARLLFAVLQPAIPLEQQKRTASLVNRQRKNPIQWWHWGLSTVACTGLLFATLWIGRHIDQSTWTPQQSFLWFWGMLGYPALVIFTYAVLYFGVRASLAEPEPLDSHGNVELQKLYDDARSNRALSMFWLLGFLQPVFFGVCLFLSTWIQSNNLIAILGATGGTLLGLAGSWAGVNATLQRLKIARLKMRLESSPGQ